MPALDRREAQVLMRLGRYDEAESLVVSSLAVLEMEEVQRPGETAWTLSQRGNIARNRGEPRQGITWLALAAETLEEAYGESHSQVGAVLVNLGLARLEAKQIDAARDVLQRAVRITENVLGPDHRELAPGLMALAHAESKSGRTKEAIALFERARAINTAQFGASSINVAYAVEGLAQVAAEEGRHEDAIAYYEEVVAARAPGAIAPSWRAQALFGLAISLVEAGRDRDRARALAEEATALFVEARGENSNDVRRTREWLAELE
jgi:tetratricopeptide (TPR) repeat protein